MSGKIIAANKIKFIDKNDRIISKDSSVSEEINLIFQNATKSVDMNKTCIFVDTVEEAFYRCINHHSRPLFYRVT